jgi:uncharacterized membrane protein YdjX (TVP38/TMEM64 family)
MKRNMKWTALIFVLIFISLVAAFFYLDRKNEISSVIISLGWPGMIISLILMAFICMTPIPSEGVLLMFLKIYGVFGGVFLAWLGSNLSTVMIFFVARHYGSEFLKKRITPERFATVDHWVKQKGTTGLFFCRLLPIPAFAVNYAAGLIPSVKLWPYLWTAAVSIIPYYIATALMFLGIIKETKHWLLIGSITILVFWLISYFLSRKKYDVNLS